MKKSEKYHMAMLAVVNSVSLNAEDKLEVIEMLMTEKSVAEYCEKGEHLYNTVKE